MAHDAPLAGMRPGVNGRVCRDGTGCRGESQVEVGFLEIDLVPVDGLQGIWVVKRNAVRSITDDGA